MDENYYGNICYCRKCNGVVHTIKKGDTLYLISKYYKVPIGEIMNANKHLNIYNLQIGDEICIPVRRPAPVEPPANNMTDNMTDNIFDMSMEEGMDENVIEAAKRQNVSEINDDLNGAGDTNETAEAVSREVTSPVTNIGNMTLNEFAKLLLKM